MAEQDIEVADKQELEDAAEPTRPGRVFVPHVDIYEDSGGLTVVADVPGAASDGVDIDLRERTLTITADVEAPESENETELAREWRSGRFYRQFSIPDAIDRDGIDASLADGVLRVRLPKAEHAQPRRIEVKSG